MKDFNESKYLDAATKFAKRHLVESPHIINIIMSVMCTRDGVGYPGGSFVQAVVDNDLLNAVARADSECIKNIRVIVSANQFCHV